MISETGRFQPGSEITGNEPAFDSSSSEYKGLTNDKLREIISGEQGHRKSIEDVRQYLDTLN